MALSRHTAAGTRGHPCAATVAVLTRTPTPSPPGWAPGGEPLGTGLSAILETIQLKGKDQTPSTSPLLVLSVSPTLPGKISK